jgi:hypothetical protein
VRAVMTVAIGLTVTMVVIVAMTMVVRVLVLRSGSLHPLDDP